MADVSPNASTSVSRWNMVTMGPHVGHVNFMLFVSFFPHVVTQRERGFWWNMGGIDNRRQSVIRAALDCSLAIYCTLVIYQMIAYIFECLTISITS